VLKLLPESRLLPVLSRQQWRGGTALARRVMAAR
jgi:hypothetical protein